MGALSTDGPELDALEPELLTKAATLLPTHIEQARENHTEAAKAAAPLLLPMLLTLPLPMCPPHNQPQPCIRPLLSAQLKQELAERQALLLLLAAACEKQAAHFPRLQAAIGECEEVLERVKGRTETDKASDRERIMIDVKEGQYSPSDN